MGKKYEILKDTKEFYFDREIYKIRALKDFADVKKGDIGGFVESEKNLSQEGDCWIYDNAKIFDDAMVFGNAKVSGNAIVSDHSEVCVNAKVYGNAIICGNAKVCGSAIIRNHAIVRDYATVSGNAVICDHAIVYGTTFIYDNAKVCNHAKVDGNARINNCAKIKNQNQWFVIDNVGSRKDNITFYETDGVIYANVGCFNGTLDEFIRAVRTTHKGNEFEKEYLKIAEPVSYTHLTLPTTERV